MKIPLVDLKAQYATLKPEIDAALARVIDRCSFILGEEVSKFERSFADFCGVTAPAVVRPMLLITRSRASAAYIARVPMTIAVTHRKQIVEIICCG